MLLTKPLLQLSEVRCVTFAVDACKYATKPSDSLYSVCAPHTLPHTVCPHTRTSVYYMCVMIRLVYVICVCMSSDALYTCVAYYYNMCPHTTTTYVCTPEPVCVCACVFACVCVRESACACVCVRACACEREWNDRCAASVRDNFFFYCPPYCCGSRPSLSHSKKRKYGGKNSTIACYGMLCGAK
jgi:hypothetical protein